jgi:hypothetical protein
LRDRVAAGTAKRCHRQRKRPGKAMEHPSREDAIC